MDGAELKPSLTQDYRNQFKEIWQTRRDAMDRHRISRIFLGKPMELFIAKDLEGSGISIVEHVRVLSLRSSGRSVGSTTVRPAVNTNGVEVKLAAI